jgi:hypothetical protein
VLEAAEAGGEMPLDYMLTVMRDPKADDKRRDAMAMAAAPYLHPKLSTIMPKPIADPDKPEFDMIEVEFVRPDPQPDDDELLD